MSEVCHAKHHSEPILDSLHVIGGIVAYLIPHLAVLHVQLADKMSEITGVDFHRARSRTKAISSASLVAIVFIRFLQPFHTVRVLACCLQIEDLALDGNAHS